MSRRFPLLRFLAVATGFAVAIPLAAVAVLVRAAAAATVTTAWQNGSFSVNPSGVVAESDIVLGAPNTSDSQSLPLGNGSLGVAAWAANGFTAQLNRSDKMPYRLSPGQLRARSAAWPRPGWTTRRPVIRGRRSGPWPRSPRAGRTCRLR